MDVLLSLSLGGLALAIPRKANAGQLVAVAVVLTTFLIAMGLIYNLDRPFSGVLALSPTAMQEIEQDAAAEFQDTYDEELPCDDEGNPQTVDGAPSPGAVLGTTMTVAATTTTLGLRSPTD